LRGAKTAFFGSTKNGQARRCSSIPGFAVGVTGLSRRGISQRQENNP